MADIALLLGPVVFQDFEVPGRVSFGGAQRLAVHRLLGGTRVIDALGRDDAEVRFQGIFSGQDATLRARMLDELRTTGTPLPLTWAVFYYTVVLTRCEAEYQNGWWIPFSIGCTVLRDEAAALVDTTLSLVDSVTSDVAAAIAVSTGSGLDLSSMQSAVSAPNATVRGTSDFVGAQVSLAAAQNAVSGAMNSTGLVLSSAEFGSALSAPAGIAALGGAVSSAQQLASLATTQGYVGRTAVNLANASS